MFKAFFPAPDRLSRRLSGTVEVFEVEGRAGGGSKEAPDFDDDAFEDSDVGFLELTLGFLATKSSPASGAGSLRLVFELSMSPASDSSSSSS